MSTMKTSMTWILRTLRRLMLNNQTKKLIYPFDEQIQEKLRILDASDLNNLTTFISSPTAGQKCSHGNFWNLVTIGSFQTTSKLLTQLMFQRRKGKCITERLLYNGSDDLFVAVQSRGIAKQNNSGTRLGYTVN